MAWKMTFFVLLLALLLQLGTAFGCPEVGDSLSDEERHKNMDRFILAYNQATGNYSNDSTTSKNSRHDHRRWISVGNPSAGEPFTVNAWPNLVWVDPTTGVVNLNPILQAAIALWEPAMAVSSLEFRPAFYEGSLCTDPNMSDEFLRIIDSTGTTQGTRSSIGWVHPSINLAWRPKFPGDGRHYMYFAREPSEDGTPNLPRDVGRMAHELGHVIGFDHEFVRPDRDHYVWFVCENLNDYRKQWEEYMTRTGSTPDAADAYMNDVLCVSRRAASDQGFSAASYLPDTRHGILGEQAWSGDTYDYDSIMGYGSYDASINPWTSKFPENAVLIGHLFPDDDESTYQNAFELQHCGNADWTQVKPSEGDIARVAQLYTIDDPAAVAIANNPKWSGVSFAFFAKRTAVPTAV